MCHQINTCLNKLVISTGYDTELVVWLRESNVINSTNMSINLISRKKSSYYPGWSVEYYIDKKKTIANN